MALACGNRHAMDETRLADRPASDFPRW